MTASGLADRLPELMEELAPARVPDYFDDILQATARTRQRPAWTSLGRWIPMDLAVRPAPFGLGSWRPLLTMLVIVALLVAAGAFLIAGSKRELPPLFGPARNGALIYSNETGDIFSLDPATGRAATIIGGASDDRFPYVSPDGQRFLFVRLSGPVPMLYSANVDGTGVREVATAVASSWNAWSPDGQRIVYIAEGGGMPFIYDVTSGATRELAVSSPVHAAHWLTDGQLLLVEEPEGSRTFWTINADGSDQHLLVTPDACCGQSVLAGRGLVGWTSWSPLADGHGTIHLLDVASGIDKPLASTDKPEFHFLDPRFSPDGNWILVNQHTPLVDGVQPALIAADGSGEAIPIGPALTKNDSEIRASFSPDGTKMLITYDDGSAWLFAIPSGEGSPMTWTGVTDASWQRLALSK